MSLLTFTDEGRKHIDQTVERAESFRQELEQAGGRLIGQYWTIGDVDGCVIFEAPNDETASALLVALSRKGNVSTRTLRVYDRQEILQIVKQA
ncbi:MAG: GYD domain-containing protein [Pirellulales bacterium]